MMRFVSGRQYLVATCCLLCPLLCGAQEPAVSSKVSWISFEVPGAFETIPVAMNDSMVVVGTYTYLYGHGESGFIRTPDGVLTTFSVENSEFTIPVAIDDAGDIGGQYFDGHIFVGFVRKADGTVDTFSPQKDDLTYVTGMNAKGAVVGYFSGLRATSPVYAYIRQHDGEIIRFHVPGSLQTAPEGIDAEGEVTGYYLSPDTNDYRSFVRSCDGVIHTFAVSGYDQTMPASINPQGTIVGTLLGTDTNYAFLRSTDGAITTFGIPGGSILPQSINASGVVTGYFYPGTEGVYEGFMRSNTGALTFFDFPGGTDTDAISINNSGVITGDYSNGFGVQSFLRIP